MYTKENFLNDCMHVFGKTAGNLVDIPGSGHVRIYDTPLIGFADVKDALFDQYKQPEIIGNHYFTPTDWLTSAKTVISFFKPCLNWTAIVVQLGQFKAIIVRRRPPEAWLWSFNCNASWQ